MNRIANSADTTISHYIKSASEDRALRKCPVDIFSKVPGSVAGRVAMGIYKEHRGTDDTLQLVEHAIYGSSRLGLNTTIVDLSDGAEDNDPVVALDYGTRQYELSDHLGNVSVVLSGTSLPNTGNTNFTADVLSANEYYPFGMVMPRADNADLAGYRYGYNGKEKDDEGLGGGGLTLDYGFRIYNPQLGKFLSVDPLSKEYPWYTPYQFAGNKPIWKIDLDGLEEAESDAQKHEIKVEVNNGMPAPGFGAPPEGQVLVEGEGGFLEAVPDPAASTDGNTTKSEAERAKFEKIPDPELSPFQYQRLENRIVPMAYVDENKFIFKDVDDYAELLDASVTGFNYVIVEGSLKEALMNDVNDFAKKDGFNLYEDLASDFVASGKKYKTDQLTVRYGPTSAAKGILSKAAWTMRNGQMRYWASYDSNGNVQIDIVAWDTFDVEPNESKTNSSNFYNPIAKALHPMHLRAGGNPNMQLRASWSVTVKQ